MWAKLQYFLIIFSFWLIVSMIRVECTESEVQQRTFLAVYGYDCSKIFLVYVTKLLFLFMIDLFSHYFSLLNSTFDDCLLNVRNLNRNKGLPGRGLRMFGSFDSRIHHQFVNNNFKLRTKTGVIRRNSSIYYAQ